MPVDRGGLEYPINVHDGFGRTFDEFVRGANASRSAYADLKKEIQGGTTRNATAQEIAREIRDLERAARARARQARQLANVTRGELGQTNALRRAKAQLTNEERKRNVEYAKGVEAARRSFAAQRTLLSQTTAQLRAEKRITDALNKRAQARATLTALEQRGLSTNLQLKKDLGVITRGELAILNAQKERRKVVDRLRQAQRIASNERLIQLKAEAAALDKINRDRIKQATNAALAARGRSDLIPGTKQAPTQQLSYFQRLTRALNATDTSANRVSFTFRRLFGILAAFTIIRRVVQEFNNLIRTMLTANAAIEQSTIGIASVLSAVGEVRNAYGEAVTGVEALTIAQEEAQKQVQLLRRDALSTVATFEQLAETFQVGLGPGLAAGLDINQVRQFTRQISIAASAIGLEQRQLAEEIRSILSGTINIRQTRIAAVLGITNEDIRQAKEAGELFEFLQEQFQAFDQAGFIAAQTFNGLVNRTVDAVRLLLAEGGLPFFNEVKDILADTLSSVQQIDAATGDITLNPELLQAARTVANALSDSLASLRELSQGVGVGGLNDLANTIGAIIRGGTRLLKIISAIGRGVLDTLNFFVGISKAVVAVVKSAGEALGIFRAGEASLENVLRLVGNILGLVVAAQVVTGAIIPLLTLIVGGLNTVGKLLKVQIAYLGITQGLAIGIGTATIGITGPVLLISAAILGILAATGVLSKTISGIGKSLGRVADLITDDIDDSLDSIINKTRDGLAGNISGTVQSLEDVRDIVSDIGREIEDLQASNEIALSIGRLGASSDVADELRALRAISNESRRAIQVAEQEARASTGNAANLREQFDDLATRSLPDVVSGVRRIGEEIDGLGPIDTFLQTGASLDRFEDLISNIDTSDPADAIQSLTFAIDILEGSLNNVNAAFADNSVARRSLRLDDTARQLETEISLLNRIRDAAVGIRSARDLTSEVDRERQILLDQELDKAFEAIRINALRRTEELRTNEAINSRAELLESQADLLRAFGFEARADALEIEANQARVTAEFRQQRTEIEDQIHLLDQIRDIARDRIAVLQGQSERTEQQENTLASLLEFEKQISEQLGLQAGAFARLTQLQENFRRGEEQRLREQEIRANGGFGEQVTQALVDLQRDLPSQFEVILDSLRSSIQGFSEFASQALFDAFDPTKKGDILANFSQFLQSLAQQIIATLIEIAVTAALLNAASGGTLGTFIGAFATGNSQFGIGKAEGGRITGKDARQAQAHPAHYRRPQGRARGGAAARPRGLHPTDTIPIWVAQNEWVVKAQTAMRLGHDAMARINAGLFDPQEMRSVLGLGERPAAKAVSIANKGMGMASGGRVRAAPASTSSSALTPSPMSAIMFPSKDSVDRFFRGEKETWKRALAEEGYYPNG